MVLTVAATEEVEVRVARASCGVAVGGEDAWAVAVAAAEVEGREVSEVVPEGRLV